LVPFASIGRRHGMLLSFKPDNIILYQQQGKSCINEVMVAVAPRGLGRDVQYQAILNPDLFAETEKIQEVSA
jgi:stage II sporulation protein GA (sporulation sigma-E factor processing peptidase)